MSLNGLNAGDALLAGVAGFIRLSKFTRAEFSPKNDCGVFACGFLLINKSSAPKRLFARGRNQFSTLQIKSQLQSLTDSIIISWCW